MGNVCTRCLLREMAGQDAVNIERYKAAIRGRERAADEEYERRLAVCKGCGRLNAGTCSACGCYVELRALANRGHCPYKLW